MSKGKRYGVRRGVPGRDLCDESGWPLGNNAILERFGLKPNGPIPSGLSEARQIGDTMVYIYPRGSAKKQYGVNRRVLAECHHCGKMVCAGHLSQHVSGNHRKMEV